MFVTAESYYFFSKSLMNIRTIKKQFRLFVDTAFVFISF